MPIRLIRGSSFDAETTKLLAEAYDKACQLAGSGITDALKERFARRIIAYATRGERDLKKLIAYAVRKSEEFPKVG
jgi:hypothetical protein